MAILHDYNCLAHGIFEGSAPICPHGCGESMVSIVHLKAPAIGTARTKGIDSTLRNLANQFGLTDMDNRGGQPVKRPDAMAAKRAEEYQAWVKNKFGDLWQSVAPGGVMHADGSIKGGEGGGGAAQTIAGMGAQPGSAIVRDEIGHVSVIGADNSTIPLGNLTPKVVAEHKAEIPS